MKTRPFFNEERVAEVSEAIAAALRPHISNEYKSTVDQASAATNAFKCGLTTGEFHVALLRALAALQVEQTVQLASLLTDDHEDVEGDQ